MEKLSDETRRRLATGWDPHVCTLKEYARQNGVSERAIRLWRSRFLREEAPAVPAGNASLPLQAAVNALQQRLEELEAAVDAAHAAAAAARAALDAAAACHDVPGGTEAAGDQVASQHAAVERQPMPPPWVSWY